MIQLTSLTSFEEFQSVKPEWSTFIGRYFGDAYYLDHEWLSQWWQCYALHADVYIFMVYKNNELAGLVPLMIQKDNFGGFPVRKLGFLGSGFGKEDFPLISDHEEILSHLFAELRKKAKWHIAIFRRLNPEESRRFETVDQVFKIEDRDVVNPVIELQGSYDDYFNARSGNFRANYRKKTKRINSWGKAEFRHVRSGDLAELLKNIEDICGDSWQAESGYQLAASEEGRTFLKALLGNFLERNILDISFIYLDEEPIAYLLGARIKNVYYAIETAYKQRAFDASPGMLLHLNVLEKLYEEGDVKKMDLGYDAPYKRKWTEDNRPEKYLELYGKGLYSRSIYSLRNSRLYEKVRTIKK